MPEVPEFKPEAPKPKVNTELPKELPEISVGTDMPVYLGNLDEGHKPEPVKKALADKTKSDATTLAKLPGGKQNLGEGDVYDVTGKAPKAGNLGEGDVYDVTGKVPKAGNLGEGDVYDVTGKVPKAPNAPNAPKAPEDVIVADVPIMKAPKSKRMPFRPI